MKFRIVSIDPKNAVEIGIPVENQAHKVSPLIADDNLHNFLDFEKRAIQEGLLPFHLHLIKRSGSKKQSCLSNKLSHSFFIKITGLIMNSGDGIIERFGKTTY